MSDDIYKELVVVVEDAIDKSNDVLGKGLVFGNIGTVLPVDMLQDVSTPSDLSHGLLTVTSNAVGSVRSVATSQGTWRLGDTGPVTFDHAEHKITHEYPHGTDPKNMWFFKWATNAIEGKCSAEHAMSIIYNHPSNPYRGKIK